MRLLLIEDDQDLLRALKMRLMQEGYDCDACDNGDDAAYYLENGGYQAVVLDRMLPGRDGLTILRDMRGAQKTGTPRLILRGSAVGILLEARDFDAAAD